MGNLEQKLKQIPFIFALNAYVKSARVKRVHRALCSRYIALAKSKGFNYLECEAASLVQSQLRKRGIKSGPLPKGKLRIFWVGANYAQDSSGIIQGLQKFGEVLLFESRPGKYEQIWPLRADYKTAKKKNSQILITQVKESLKTGPIHAVIGQVWAHTIDPDVLKELQEMGLIVVNISMDDRHAFRGQKINGKWTGTAGLIGSIDLACTGAEECCLWYSVEGCPSIYLPEASDPELFTPLINHKVFDVSFVGKAYGIRSKIVKTIEKSGVHVEAFGSGWPNGIIPTEKMPELFAKSRIVLGRGTIGHCSDFYALKMRDFDGPMSGSLYITHDNPDLYNLYEIGKEIVTYRTPEECADKVVYYLNHPDKAEAIAKTGRERAVRDHTWEKRFEKMFQVVGLIN